MRTIHISVCATVFILIICANIYALSLTNITLVVEHVVVETEMPYIETSKGMYSLPDFTNVVNMDSNSIDKLVLILEANKEKKVRLYLYDNVVVGVEGYDKTVFTPRFKENIKLKYKNKPIKILATMQMWVADTYMLFIGTDKGTYCINNDYKYKDYYRKVYKKLASKIEMEKRTNLEINIFFHKPQHDGGCLGEIEDISF